MLTWNRRNHRKTCTIDGHIVWIGSFNVTDDHLNPSQDGSRWRDTAVRIDSKYLSRLRDAFQQAWTGKRLLPAEGRFDANIRTFSSTTLPISGKRGTRSSPVGIRSAFKRVWITTPYFSPDRKLRRSLKLAAERGVDVKILIPKRTDVSGMDWVNSIFSKRLSGSG